MIFHHYVHGLYIESVLPLPELCKPEKDEARSADVTVLFGKSPLPQGKSLDEKFCLLNRQESLLFWPATGCFRVREGREIVIEPAEGVADDLLRPFLLAAVLPILMLQRGFCVLHASATALHLPNGTESDIVFLGYSGQGKSTMATALQRRGHRALVDDTIALPMLGEDQSVPLWLHPALPHLKLRLPSVMAFGEDPAALPRWSANDDSYLLRLSPDQSRNPAPLRGLYVLEESSVTSLERLEPAESLMYLMRHAYSIGLLPDDDLAANFNQCVRIADTFRCSSCDAQRISRSCLMWRV